MFRDHQLQLLRQMRRFRIENDLIRMAEYPASAPYHFSIVAVIVVLESIANMYFFAQGNSLGLLGGLLQALLISLTNVGFAVVVGLFGLRQINHIRPAFRFLGYASLTLFVLFVLAFNFLAAHYRDLIAVSPDTALQNALPHAIRQPHVLSFDSIMLFIVGLVASALGLRKGYTSDDPYPGYGAKDRKYKEVKRAFLEARRASPEESYDYHGTED